jgi:quinoprotein glucose dehydrogenase
MGSMTAAQALAGIAGARTHTAPVREEALLALGAWARPGIRDRVTGNFHPVGDAGHGGSVPTVRDASPAKQALTRVLPSLLASGTAERVRLAALQAARSLDLRSAMSGVERLLAERSPAGARTRRAVLELLAAWKAPQLGRAVARAAADPDPAVRTRALGLEIGLFPARAGALLGKALRSGSDLEKKAALDAVTKIEAADIDAAQLAGVDALAAGTFPPAAELELIEAAAARKEPTIKARVQSLLAARREAAEQPGRELDSYREALVGGDPEQGSQIFFKNQQVQCLRCHKINGEGADVGPDLSTVARDRDARFLLESVARPSAHFAPGFEAVILTMKDGGIKGGVVKQETATHLDLLTPDLETDRAEKARIARREAGASGMPEGFADILSRRELRDLVAYLATLK